MKPNWLGVAIAATLVLGGISLFASPQKMTVYHAGPPHKFKTNRGLPTADRITPARSYFYGGALLVIGLAVGVFAVYSPKRWR